MSLSKYFYIAIGGALGAIARFWVDSAMVNRLGTKFPYGTLVINITACLLLGFSLTFLARRTGSNPAWRFLVPIGFLGAYSTFSSYEWEIFSTVRGGDFSAAALYAFISLFLGLAAVWFGVFLADVIS
jgi:CrcB protein